ncbi:hypothetical protein K438DRAFT_1809143 [Mycena galopus ATCC 62051]|nr:hypothetical protein K438DRAFT_1809143 [Mycena galopus ATCC 62051]
MAAPLDSFPRLTSSVLNRDVAQPLPLRRGSFIGPTASLSLSETAMPRRAVSQAASISRLPGNISMPSVAPTISLPASVAPTPVTVQAAPAPVTTVVVTSVLAPIAPTTTSSPAPVVQTAVYTTVTQVFTTTPVQAYTTPHVSTSTPAAAPAATSPDTGLVGTALVGTTGAVYGPPKSSSGSFTRPASSASAARSSASIVHSSTPALHKPKSNTGKYVGYAIGAVFFLTLISSFISAYRKHRKYVKKRPRGSIFIGSKFSDGESSPRKPSMAQALMRSVSNRSFDAYALSNTPPTSPAPVYLNGSQQSHSDILNRRGFSPSTSPLPRPLPPTPTSAKFPPIQEDDPVFYPHVPSPVDPREYSPFGVSSSGSSTQTSDLRWQSGDYR